VRRKATPEAVAEGQRLQGANRPVTMGDQEAVPDVLMIPDHNATCTVTNTPPFMRGFAPPPTLDFELAFFETNAHHAAMDSVPKLTTPSQRRWRRCFPPLVWSNACVAVW
jgi:hypothetical protein